MFLKKYLFLCVENASKKTVGLQPDKACARHFEIEKCEWNAFTNLRSD